MLASANEAANVLAEHISGSTSEFANLMTEKAIEIGCTNTNFVNANGMHDDNHYTTAEDLCLIANYCFKNKTFQKIIQTVSYTIPATDIYPKDDRYLVNTNALINSSNKYYYEYALGGKTGYTSQAGNCLVAFAKKDGVTLICVILKAHNTEERFTDAKTLFDFGFDNFSTQKIAIKGTVVDTVTVENATKDSKSLNLTTSETISDYIANDTDLENLEYEINLDNTELSAPIYTGDKLGTITYILNGKEYTTDIVAETTAYSKGNYISFALFTGLVLLVVSIIIIPKKRQIKT